MKFLNSIVLSLLLSISTVSHSFAESQSTPVAEEKEKIQKLMKEGLGLENIDIQKTQDDNISVYKISYENRTFLHEIHVFGALFSELKNIIPDNSYLEIYPQSNGQVMTKLSLNFQDYLDFMASKITEDEFAQKIEVNLNPQYKPIEKYNPLRFHTDLVLAPSYILDGVSGPSILFSPYINMFLDNGFTLNTRYRVSLYNVTNGFDLTKNAALVPPGFRYTTLEYSSPVLNQPLFATARLGHLYDNNAHNLLLSGDMQYIILNGLFNVNLMSGVTLNTTTGVADFSISPYGQFYLGKYDLVFEAGAGKFLFGEYGGWGRLTRQFDNVDIGFSIFRGFGTPQSGFKLSFEYNIAIGAEHGIHTGPIRVTYPRFFSGDLVAGLFSGNLPPRYKAEDFVKRLYPEYIKTHLYYWLSY